jgi:hypothetical protein
MPFTLAFLAVVSSAIWNIILRNFADISGFKTLSPRTAPMLLFNNVG